MSSPAESERKSQHSLRDYQCQLAERTSLATKSRAVLNRQLGFLAAGRGWLIDLGDASEIMPAPVITPVPGTQPWFVGLINHRGRLTSVIDFERFLGSPPLPPKTSDRLIVLSERFALSCSLRVATVNGLMDLPADITPIAASLDRARWEGGGVQHQGRQWHRLALHELIADPRFADAALR